MTDIKIDRESLRWALQDRELMGIVTDDDLDCLTRIIRDVVTVIEPGGCDQGATEGPGQEAAYPGGRK